MMKSLKRMTRKQYVVAGGDLCPFCRSRVIEAVHAPVVMRGKATQDLECCDCGKQWVDCHELTGHIPKEQG